jgi:hypothetical protein
MLQAAGYSLTLGRPRTKMRDHLGQCGRVDARRQVTVRIEFRPSLHGASLSSSRLSGKRKV